MYRPNLLKTRIKQGENVYGCWNGLGSAYVTEVMGLAGYEFIIFDHEHGLGDLTTLGQQFQALRGTATTPLVRVPGHEAVYLKRVLDLGAEGVIIPSVNTAEEAKAVVSFCRYPPFGIRGAAPTSIRASSFGFMGADYAKTSGDNTLVICQIESVEGVENAAKIAAVDGVDMIFIGPYDLSGSAGYLGQMNHPEVLKLIGIAEKAAKAAGKPLGTILRPGMTLQELFGHGYQLVAAGSDLSRLREACIADMTAYRESIAR